MGASDETINLICQSLGPVILRARVDSFSILNSKVPIKFVYELIKHCKEIFSESTLKLHAESEKRRLARPIIAPQPQGDEAKSSKRGNTLMSFMRPTINTAEELNKWTVNSMMGVFQRNTNQSPTDQQQQQQQQPATTNRSVPLAFGSTITQDSPPSSPRLTPAVEKVEENKVVFDGDHIFDDEVQDSKSEDILKDIEEKSSEKTETKDEKKKDEDNNTQERPSQSGHIDSSFFDDDDEEDEN